MEAFLLGVDSSHSSQGKQVASNMDNSLQIRRNHMILFLGFSYWPNYIASIVAKNVSNSVITASVVFETVQVLHLG